MSSPFESILVLGSGELGAQVIASLRSHPRFATAPLTVLQRSARLPPPLQSYTGSEEVKVLQCDIAAASIPVLARHFDSFSTIISCTGFVGGSGTQGKLASAVLASRSCRLYVPWQFGVDYDKVGRGSDQVLFDEQLDVRDMLRSQERVAWLIVSTGMFTSFLFEVAFGVVDRDGKVCRALGSWKNEVTVTSPEDIGKSLAAVLAAGLCNQVVFIGGDTVSYGQVADAATRRLESSSSSREEAVRREVWSVQHLTEALQADPTNSLKMYRLVFAKGTGMSWPLEDCWNVKQGLVLQTLEQWCEKNLQ